MATEKFESDRRSTKKGDASIRLGEQIAIGAEPLNRDAHRLEVKDGGELIFEDIRLVAQAKPKETRKPSEPTPQPAPAEFPDNSIIPRRSFAKEFQYANGLMRYNTTADGKTITESAFRTNPAANGDYEEYYRGAGAQDNFVVQRRMQTNGSVQYECLGPGNVSRGKITVRTDGTILVHPAKDANGREVYRDYSKTHELLKEVSISTDEKGNTIEKFSNGGLRIRYADGSQFQRGVSDDKSGRVTYLDRHGKIIYQEDFDKDGKFSDVGPGEKQLTEQLAKLSPDARRQFEADLKEFKKRAEVEHVSRVEVQLTMEAAANLLAAGGDKPLTPDRRIRLAGFIIHNAAHPEKIGQGQHSSCASSSDEIEKYRAHPSIPALAVAAIGLTGEYEDASGRKFHVDPTPHDTSRKDKVEDGERNHASEIYQVLAMKVGALDWGQRHNMQVEYEQVDVSVSKSHCDTGERFYEIKPDGKRVLLVSDDGKPKTGLFFDSIARLGKDTLNELPASLMYGDGSHKRGPGGPKTESPYLVHTDCGAGRDAVFFASESEFANKLLEYKRNGQLPVRVGINIVCEPFRTLSGGWIVPGDNGSHAITVTDVSVDEAGKPIAVKVDNSWSSNADAVIPLHDFYLATRAPANILAELKEDLSKNYTAEKALALLHVQISTKELTLEQAVKKAEEVVDRCKGKAASKAVLSRLDALFLHLPGKLAVPFLQHEHQAGLIDATQYDQRLRDFYWRHAREQVCRQQHGDTAGAKVCEENLTAVDNHLGTLPEVRRKKFEDWKKFIANLLANLEQT